ncbi:MULTISPECIES: AraC family ligand binding domain-containing protein [Achromobacter]|jgi:quercetin dioxygenase-like cupin family protein|uniref:Cupin domain-containing protein n=1 Tax=Alcaligenes xylosoxydans xylosoxydans TaxID=85698 RepID=A0A424WDU3_ALCXX|nr:MULTISPECIES: AraC family ligand binding domain-containing protein [Achromobacter]MBC9903406.1 AraC family ligand binding domain-containing protein [Achromobacter xylosoxidans]MBD0867289.1 AraC family ligand binding domain-containing protein [Achromobacter xylosoxidans]QNP88315.1 AraC family ligand binding domain-containing protein [Achromobacter xylosoxidans]RPJ91435.1 cupin domain-containing protein [Achromobacter xylosoxidans]WLW64322.1 AraC family ligand binding domain-containing protei
MALKHAAFLDVIDIRTPHREHGEAVSVSLMKTAHMQLLQLALPAGKGLPQHAVAGEITIHCIAGEVSVALRDGVRQLRENQLVALPAHEPHALQAVRDATVLVTVLHAPA